MQKIKPKRSVGGATQQQPSRTISPLTQLPLFHHHAVTHFQTWYLSQTLRLHQHSKTPAKSTRYNNFSRPSLGLKSQLHTSKQYAKYKPVGLSPIITSVIQISKLDKQKL